MLGGSRPGCPLSPRRRCALTSVPELSTVCVCVLTGGEFLSSAVRRASAARQCEAAACTHACPPACTSTPPAHPRGHHAAASRAPWVPRQLTTGCVSYTQERMYAGATLSAHSGVRGFLRFQLLRHTGRHGVTAR